MAQQDDQHSDGNDGPADEIAQHIVDLIDDGHEPHRVAAAGLGLYAAAFDRYHGVGAAERMLAEHTRAFRRVCAN